VEEFSGPLGVAKEEEVGLGDFGEEVVVGNEA